eukprot:1161027-Pelagomonas_calceolata.AAC.3
MCPSLCYLIPCRPLTGLSALDAAYCCSSMRQMHSWGAAGWITDQLVGFCQRLAAIPPQGRCILGAPQVRRREVGNRNQLCAFSFSGCEAGEAITCLLVVGGLLGANACTA